MQSTFLTLNWKDAGKAAIMLFVSTFLASVYSSLSTTPIHFPTLADLKVDAIAGGISALGYLIKNLFSDDVAAAKSTLITAAQKDGSSQVVLSVPPTVTASKP